MLKSHSALLLQETTSTRLSEQLVLLINQPHPQCDLLLLLTCIGPACLMGAGVQASRTRSMTVFVVWFPVQNGLICMNLGKGHSLCFTRGEQCSNAQTCVLSENWFLFISPPQSPEMTVHLPFQKSTKKKQNSGKDFSVSSARCQGYQKRNADIYSWAVVKLNKAIEML